VQVDTPPLPDASDPPKAAETEQAAAILGLPILPLSLPAVRESQPVEPSASDSAPAPAVQVAFLPNVATDAPIIAPMQTQRAPQDEALLQASSPAEEVTTPESSQPKAFSIPERTDNLPLQAKGTQPSPVVDGGSTVNLQTPFRLETESVVTASPPAETARAETKDTPRPSPDGAVTVQNTPEVSTRLEQPGNVGQFGHGTGQERRDNAPPAQRIASPQAKKPRLAPAEHPSTVRHGAAATQEPHTVEFVATLHRATAHTAPAAEVSPVEVVRQVVTRIETMAHQPRTDSVTLQLEPEHLGKLRVTISVNDGTIHTHIVADNHAVRQMLESNSALLQQALQERGLHLAALQVSVQGDGRQFHLNQPYTPQRPTGGWLETGSGNAGEANFAYTTAGGINLLV
ncbi:MAG: flagellar hook-length control protein FliK, partial [Armatimonadota bacterium]